MNQSYVVQAHRVELPHNIDSWHKVYRTTVFYLPTMSTTTPNGRTVYEPFLDHGEMPFIWGFETEKEAWEACDMHLQNNRPEEPEELYCFSSTDREDFYSDV